MNPELQYVKLPVWLFRDGWRIRLQAEELHLHIREIKRSISHTHIVLCCSQFELCISRFYLTL